MATSSGRRLLRYLYSSKNLAGSAAGLAGLGLHFTRQVLLDQLALLGAKLGEVLDAIARGDADRLLAHGRFLEDRFGRSEVDLR